MITLLASTACISVALDSPQITNEPLEIIYEIPSTNTKAVSYKEARNFFANKLEDSNKAIKVADEADGLIIGRSTISWRLTFTNNNTIECQSSYSFNFSSINKLTTLKIKLDNKAPSTSACKGWDLPSKNAYQNMMNQFDAMALELAQKLQGNQNPKISKAYK